MDNKAGGRRGPITRNATGLAAAEAFIIVAIATILITRLYLRLTGYPQIGGGDLHIAHALYGGALMMLALLLGWLMLGFGVQNVSVVLGGVGFGLFLDEVGKFVTKDNDYFYRPTPEIMYILVVVILVGARIVRDFRPLSGRECLASAAQIAAEGVARGLAVHRRDLGLTLLERARVRGADQTDIDHVHELLMCAEAGSERLYDLQRRVVRLIPGFFRNPRWVPVAGGLIVVGSVLSLIFSAFGGAPRGYLSDAHHLTMKHDLGVAHTILLISAVLTLGIALPAMIARRRTANVWPLRWLRNAALISALLNALANFATEGFGALVNLSAGLFTMAILSYQLDVAARAEIPPGDQTTVPTAATM